MKRAATCVARVVDADTLAAIAAFKGKVQVIEASTPRYDRKFGSMTQGFAFAALRDTPERKKVSRPYHKHEVSGVNMLMLRGAKL